MIYVENIPTETPTSGKYVKLFDVNPVSGSISVLEFTINRAITSQYNNYYNFRLHIGTNLTNSTLYACGINGNINDLNTHLGHFVLANDVNGNIGVYITNEYIYSILIVSHTAGIYYPFVKNVIRGGENLNVVINKTYDTGELTNKKIAVAVTGMIGNQYQSRFNYYDGNSWIQVPTIDPRSSITNATANIVPLSGYYNRTVVFDGNVYRNFDGTKVNTPIEGNFANKPTVADHSIYRGFRYFCIDRQTTEGATMGIDIIHKGSDVWVDALGRVVS